MPPRGFGVAPEGVWAGTCGGAPGVRRDQLPEVGAPAGKPGLARAGKICGERRREPAVGLLRPGDAGSSTPSDHVKATTAALAHLPKRLRGGRRTLIRTDSPGRHP